MKTLSWVLGFVCLCLLVATAAWGPEVSPRARGARRGARHQERGAVLGAGVASPVLPDPAIRPARTDACGPDANEAVRAIQERLMEDLVVSACLTDSQRDLAGGVLRRLQRREQQLLAEIDLESLTKPEADRINGRLNEIARNARRDLERLLLPDQVRAFEGWCGRTGLTAPAALAVLDEDAGE